MESCQCHHQHDHPRTRPDFCLVDTWSCLSFFSLYVRFHTFFLGIIAFYIQHDHPHCHHQHDNPHCHHQHDYPHCLHHHHHHYPMKGNHVLNQSALNCEVKAGGPCNSYKLAEVFAERLNCQLTRPWGHNTDVWTIISISCLSICVSVKIKYH